VIVTFVTESLINRVILNTRNLGNLGACVCDRGSERERDRWIDGGEGFAL